MRYVGMVRNVRICVVVGMVWSGGMVWPRVCGVILSIHLKYESREGSFISHHVHVWWGEADHDCMCAICSIIVLWGHLI